jgi:hypothetical protein
MYYENGYEAISADKLAEYMSLGLKQAVVPLKFIGVSLRMIGKADEVDRALDFIRAALETCGGGSAEFAMHFLCEENFSVKILRITNFRVKTTAA